MRRNLCVPLASILVGCTAGRNYKRPIVSTPLTFRGQAIAESYSLADLAWWDAFPDPTLDALIKEALAKNKGFLTTVARVEEARDLVVVAIPRDSRNVFAISPLGDQS
jgi:multidrug efflux system outer membrane protein